MSTVLNGSVPAPSLWKSGVSHWGGLALAGAAAAAAFYQVLYFMVATWGFVEEYSYGYFIPAIVAFMIWQKADRLRLQRLDGNWGGLALVAVALVMLFVGTVSAVRVFAQYGFVLAVFGIAVCAIGWRGTRIVAVPLALLFTMIPLPQFVLRELSNSLQLISSQLGVWLIRLFDISVYLEGNVIDLGSYKLQVVEACSGLRYLFPLIVLGVLAAYFFKGAMWKRVLIVLSTIPMTIVINSLRIGLIGVTVEHWGPKMAEGLLHDFEGWFMFMLCIALLIGEMALLARVGGGGSLRSVFGLDAPLPIPKGATLGVRQASAPLLCAGVLMAAVGAYALWKPPQEPVAPPRASFSQFPLDIKGGWRGKPDALATDVLAIIAVQDYFLANFARPGEPSINFYAAYYASQGGGESSHSPRTCLPGGGWEMSQIGVRPVALGGSLGTVPVNRAIIQQGEHRQLVYYWFRQRGRELTDEMAVKWFILADGISRNRSDGALLRLVTPLGRTEDVASGDARLAEFLAQIQPRLAEFVPD